MNLPVCDHSDYKTWVKGDGGWECRRCNEYLCLAGFEPWRHPDEDFEDWDDEGDQ